MATSTARRAARPRYATATTTARPRWTTTSADKACVAAPAHADAACTAPPARRSADREAVVATVDAVPEATAADCPSTRSVVRSAWNLTSVATRCVAAAPMARLEEARLAVLAALPVAASIATPRACTPYPVPAPRAAMALAEARADEASREANAVAAAVRAVAMAANHAVAALGAAVRAVVAAANHVVAALGRAAPAPTAVLAVAVTEEVAVAQAAVSQEVTATSSAALAPALVPMAVVSRRPSASAREGMSWTTSREALNAGCAAISVEPNMAPTTAPNMKTAGNASVNAAAWPKTAILLAGLKGAAEATVALLGSVGGVLRARRGARATGTASRRTWHPWHRGEGKKRAGAANAKASMLLFFAPAACASAPPTVFYRFLRTPYSVPINTYFFLLFPPFWALSVVIRSPGCVLSFYIYRPRSTET